MIKASSLLKKIERKVPLSLALDGDQVGFIGPGDTDRIEVERILVLMDYIPPRYGDNIDYGSYDLLVLHHPPLSEPEIPTYVIHSNWDVVAGGSCDALADCLNVKSDEILDKDSGLGRIGCFIGGPVLLSEFSEFVMDKLGIDNLRIVNYEKDFMIEKIGLISGFGLIPEFIQMAKEREVDLFLSGDLTHKGALIAKNSGIVLIDASHYATELPGLYRLGELISKIGIMVHVMDTHVPWKSSFKKQSADDSYFNTTSFSV